MAARNLRGKYTPGTEARPRRKPPLGAALASKSPWRLAIAAERGGVAHAVAALAPDATACNRAPARVFAGTPFSLALLICAGAPVCRRCARAVRR